MLILCIKTMLFSVIVPGTVAVLLPNMIIEQQDIINDGEFYPGILLMMTGFFAYCWCVWDFIHYGRGTPAPMDAPQRLVIRGLYRYSRNPMYVAVLLVILGWGILYLSLSIFIYALFVALMLNLFVIFYEEPILEDEFAAEYRQYQVLVNRWLPGLKTLM